MSQAPRDAKTILYGVKMYNKGAKQAAGQANAYNASSSHPFWLGDCILSKMKLRGSLRRNHQQINLDNEWLRGFALALVEINKIFRQPRHVHQVMSDAGVTIVQLKKAGVPASDLNVLRRKK